MFELILTLATAAVIAFAIALAGSVAAKRIAWRWRMVALPGPDSRHVEPTAMLGGVAIAIAFLASLALCGKLTMWVAAITCALTAVGLVDDLLVLRPGQKLAAQVAAALGFIIAGPPLALVHLRWLNSVLVFLWLIGTTNAFNLIDGLDGLAGGVGALAGLAVAVTAMLHHNPALALCAVALSGALCGFLVFNFHPASIFMGDAGALPVGFLLGIFALEAGRLSTNSGLAAFVFPVLVMIVPILDTAIVSTTRLATGRPISKRGLDHTHHRLLSLGVADRNVTYGCWGVGLLGALCAVGSSIVPHAYLVVALPFVLMPPALVALFMMDLTFDSRAPGIEYGDMPRLARLTLRASYKLRIVEASLDVMLIAAAYFGAFLIRLDFTLSPRLVDLLMRGLPWVLGATYPAFFATGVYRGMWRYTGLADAIRFATGTLAAGVCVLLISPFARVGFSGSIIVLFMLLLFNLLLASRMSFRLLRKASARLTVPLTRVLVVGAGRFGAAAGKELEGGKDRLVCLIGFADDDVFKHGKLVAGVPVLGSLDDLEQIYNRTPFNQILIAATTLSAPRLELVRNFAHEHNIVVRRFSLEVRDAALGLAAANGASDSLAAAGR